jgi:hypothetical protein
VVLAVIAAFIYGAIIGPDYLGLRAHEVEAANITATGSWMVGESRPCTSFPVDKETARYTGVLPGYSFKFIECDPGMSSPEPRVRQMKITFYGRKLQPEYSVVNWTCIRQPEQFTCRELSGSR